MKTCFKCGLAKDYSGFYRHKSMGDGYLGKCKECAKKDTSDWRISKHEEVRAYDKARNQTPERKSKSIVYQKIFRAANEEKYKARTAIGNWLRDTGAQRPPCEVCGDPKSDAHHEDYSKPLEVIWLCRKHHAERHIEIKKEKALKGIK